MAKKTERCAHSACNCPAHRGSGFCSDYCKRAKATGETGCRCGHQRCKAKVL